MRGQAFRSQLSKARGGWARGHGAMCDCLPSGLGSRQGRKLLLTIPTTEHSSARLLHVFPASSHDASSGTHWQQSASSVCEHQRPFRRGVGRGRCPKLLAHHAGRQGPQKTNMACGPDVRGKLDAMCEPSFRPGGERQSSTNKTGAKDTTHSSKRCAQRRRTGMMR